MKASRLLAALLVAAGVLVRPVEAAPTGPAPTGPAALAGWTTPHVAGQLLVKLPAAEGSAHLPGVRVLRQIPELGLALVEAPGGKTLPEAASVLVEDGSVEWAEPNYTIGLDYVPNDPSYLPQQSRYLDRMGAEAAWDVTQGRPEIVIAVLDTGVDMQHEDLAGAIWTNAGEISGNGLDDEGNGFVDDVHGWDFAENDNLADDDYGHGTHVAGIVAARTDNGTGIAGLAGRATIMPVDVFQGGIGTYEALIRAMVYAADNGAHVINMSLGASSYSRGEEAAVDYAHTLGVVVVAAAGNSGREERHYPAAHRNSIAVASTTADDYLSSFSTRGDWVDVAAPGSSIYSTYRGNSYTYMSGTSMATPHVSGLAALILSRNPALAPDQVRALLESTAQDLGPAGSDIYFGAGRISAARALAATPAGGEPPPPPMPGPGLDIDLEGCTEMIGDGGFEARLADWQAAGDVEVVGDPVSAGSAALHFKGGPRAGGVVTHTLVMPAKAKDAVLRFDYRIEPRDYGRGSSPAWPFDDWFTLEWRSANGAFVQELLRTGNTADTVTAGLEWDHYLYRLSPADLEALQAAGPLNLVFKAQNDSDSYPTDVWLDAVSLCATGVTLDNRQYLPIYLSP